MGGLLTRKVHQLRGLHLEEQLIVNLGDQPSVSEHTDPVIMRAAKSCELSAPACQLGPASGQSERVAHSSQQKTHGVPAFALAGLFHTLSPAGLGRVYQLSHSQHGRTGPADIQARSPLF